MGRPIAIDGESCDRVLAKDRAEFVRIMRALNRLITRIRKYEPKANLYVEDCGNMCLMVGDSHDGYRERMRQDLVACTITVPHCGGGGW